MTTPGTQSWRDGIDGAILRIAETNHSPLRVLAGPGTGKTFALIHWSHVRLSNPRYLERRATSAKATSGGLRVKSERLAEPLLPQHFADRFGWENMAAQVVKVFQNLPPSDRAKVCIFTGNYGEAGAIEFFGRKLEPRLPPVLSGLQ